MMTANHTSRLLGIAALLAAIFAAPLAEAQKTTERYIPIGQSPGVSNVLTVVGTVGSTDPQRRSITIATPSGPLTAVIRAEADIWIDRSKLRETNLNGNFTDLQSGRTVEIKFQNADRRQVVDWVKVAAPGSP